MHNKYFITKKYGAPELLYTFGKLVGTLFSIELYFHNLREAQHLSLYVQYVKLALIVTTL